MKLFSPDPQDPANDNEPSHVPPRRALVWAFLLCGPLWLGVLAWMTGLI